MLPFIPLGFLSLMYFLEGPIIKVLEVNNVYSVVPTSFLVLCQGLWALLEPWARRSWVINTVLG